MTYTKQTWVNGSPGGTPINAARLTHIENGIEDVEADLLDALDDKQDVITPGTWALLAENLGDIPDPAQARANLAVTAANIPFTHPSLDADDVQAAIGELVAEGTAITDLPVATVVTADDLFIVTNDPLGLTPETRSATGTVVQEFIAPVPQRFRTVVDQGIVDTTTVNVTGLSGSLLANTTYEFIIEVIFDSTTANDARFGLTFPAGATLFWYGLGPASNATTPLASGQWEVITTSGLQTYGGSRATGAAARKLINLMRGRITTAGTAGTLQVRAQKNANTDTATPADDLTIYTGSGGTISRIPA